MKKTSKTKFRFHGFENILYVLFIFGLIFGTCPEVYAGSFAIAGHGAWNGTHDTLEDGRAAKTGFDDWKPASTGEQLLSRLETFSASEPIDRLYTFSHGYGRGLVLEHNKGFYVDDHGLDDAASLSDLQTKINEGIIRFAPNSVIRIQACNVGSGWYGDNFAKILSEITGGTVYAATGISAPCNRNKKETGWFSSGASPWGKWENGVKLPSPHVTDDDLTTPNAYGKNYLKFWGPPKPSTVKSSDASGTEKNCFTTIEMVYAKGTGVCNTNYNIYVCSHPVNNGDSLSSCVSSSVNTNSHGYFRGCPTKITAIAAKKYTHQQTNTVVPNTPTSE